MKLDGTPMTNENAAALLRQGLDAIRAGDAVFDLSGVTAVDSAAVALLLAWSREAQVRDTRLAFSGVPVDIESLARLYGVDGLLGIAPPKAA
jgi:phospholipid transport system transporter-binding protein